MDGIDRIDRAYRVDPAGYGQRRRRDTEEEFREFLEKEREEREREEKRRSESQDAREQTPSGGIASELPPDIVDIRLRTIHNFNAVADSDGVEAEGEIERPENAEGEDAPSPIHPPPEIRQGKIDEIV
ncbi:MAG: hypothetical protein HRF49_10350 [bacterium]|jgi:hypothetical protein